MRNRKHLRGRAAAGAGAVLVALAATACSGGGTPSAQSSAQSPTQTSTQPAAQAAPPTVTTRTTQLGKVLVTGKGLTLYLFLADKTSKSTCKGGCADAWPPLVVSGKPTAAGGVRGNLLSTSDRGGGVRQVTYHGHPLYRFAGDRKPGDLNGQGLNNFGALWYVLGTNGKQITKAAPTPQPPGGYAPPPKPGG